ncbi:MAG: cytochrome P450 [Alphaproteobacteria bacterium]|nr:cytochrome P450 [Alphaproteobacteria bacterium]
MNETEAEEKGRKAALKPLEQTTLADRDVIGCPYHTYKKLREEAPVNKDPVTGFYTVTCYADVQKALRDTATFSSRVGKLLTPPDASSKLEDRGGYPAVDTLLTADPPKHKFYRAPVNKVFSAARVEQMAPYIQQIIDELLGVLITDGQCEFVSQFATLLPLTIIADQLGVPRRDIPTFKLWSDAHALQLSGLATREQRQAASKLILEYQKYFARVIEEKRAEPTDDIISDLVRAPMENGVTMDTPELLSVISQLLVAGNETTASTLSKGILLLIEHPGQLQLLQNDLTLVENLSEEVLRFEAPVQGLFRVTTCDTSLGGVFMPKGSPVMLMFASANRDERQFAAGETFDVQRRNAATHMSFGQGTHFCLGAMLARKELNMAFKSILTRMKNIRLAPGHPHPDHEPSMILRGLKELHITFDPA